MKIFNPITKRYIKQTSGNHRKGSSRWQKIMYEEGGYIAHCGELVPIILESLRDDRNPAKEHKVDYDISKTYNSTNLAPIDHDD